MIAVGVWGKKAEDHKVTDHHGEDFPRRRQKRYVLIIGGIIAITIGIVRVGPWQMPLRFMSLQTLQQRATSSQSNFDRWRAIKELTRRVMDRKVSQQDARRLATIALENQTDYKHIWMWRSGWCNLIEWAYVNQYLDEQIINQYLSNALSDMSHTIRAKIESEDPLPVLRYVERNALRARLVRRAENWHWGSLWRRRHGATGENDPQAPILNPWPIDHPRHWLRTVNASQSDAVLQTLRTSVNRGQPYGSERWVKRQTQALGLASTFRQRGRPRKNEK